MDWYTFWIAGCVIGIVIVAALGWHFRPKTTQPTEEKTDTKE